MTTSALQDTKSMSQKALGLGSTPWPAWTFAGSIFATPLVSNSMVTASSRIKVPAFGSSPTAAAKLVRIGPNTMSVALFGSALALGGYMTYDGDASHGAGFSSCWSVLYLLANGGKAFKGIRYGRFWPALLSMEALGTSVMYGKSFVWE